MDKPNAGGLFYTYSCMASAELDRSTTVITMPWKYSTHQTNWMGVHRLT